MRGKRIAWTRPSHRCQSPHVEGGINNRSVERRGPRPVSPKDRMKTTALSHCAAVPACYPTAPRSLPARLKQLTLTAAAALALVLAPVASAATSTFTVLQNLDYSTTGGSPSAGLVQGTDGALYGTTKYGGSGAVGTVFKLNPDGSGFTVLQNLDYYPAGGYPQSGLVQATD